MDNYEVRKIEKDFTTGNIGFGIVSTFGDKQFSIWMWYAADQHIDEYPIAEKAYNGEVLAGLEKQKFNNMIKKLHEENIRALVKAGHLDVKTKLPV